MSCGFLCSALRQLHGLADSDGALEDIEKERNNLVGFQAKKPWELFGDRSLRWQLLTIILLNTAQQLNGINAVCIKYPMITLLHCILNIRKVQIIFFCFRSISMLITFSVNLVFLLIKYHMPLLAQVPANALQL